MPDQQTMDLFFLKRSNYPIYSFVNSTPPLIPLIAQFTASLSEAKYLRGSIRFLNVMVQGDFGERTISQDAR